MIDWDCERLLVALVALMPVDLVRRHLGHSSFDRALNDCMLRGQFPPWFRDYFTWDHQSGVFNEKWYLLVLGKRDLMICCEMPSGGYRSTISDPVEAFELAADLGISEVSLRTWAEEISAILRAG